MRLFQQAMALFLSGSLVGAGGFAQTSTPSAQAPPQAAQQSAEQLQQLVAPIALYPDALIAQILAAATYPDQVVEAQKWLEQNNKSLESTQLAQEVDKQPWDPSVKALTQFPAVLANMNQNLAWTSELGDAQANQQQELTQAIQVMRERAKQAGNLNSTSEEKVNTKGQTIVIQPTETDTVYVPQYDPWLVYGEPLAMFPGWDPYPGLFLDYPGIGFGLGFGIGLFAGYGWGWHHWGYDWHHDGRVVYNHNTYISHSRSIVSRNDFHSGRASFNRGGEAAHGHGFNGAQSFQGGNAGRGRGFSGAESFHGGSGGMHSGAFSGFSHGGVARANSFQGRSSFGGFHGMGGGGFHGGGGGFHGGGGRR